jgi:hypothetical protein
VGGIVTRARVLDQEPLVRQAAGDELDVLESLVAALALSAHVVSGVVGKWNRFTTIMPHRGGEFSTARTADTGAQWPRLAPNGHARRYLATAGREWRSVA